MNSILILEWFPPNLQSVHAVLQYNIAVAKTIKGQFDQASTILKQVWQQRSKVCRVPAHIVMLFIYIELQLGEKKFWNSSIRCLPAKHREIIFVKTYITFIIEQGA